MRYFIDKFKKVYSISVLFSNCFIFFRNYIVNIDIKGMNAVF